MLLPTFGPPLVCFRNMSINTLHKGCDYGGDDHEENNNNNNSILKKVCTFVSVHRNN